MYLSTFLLSVFIFTFFLILYISSVHPSLPHGDSGELMTVAWNLGVAHPPGYPLFTMLYHALGRHVFYNSNLVRYATMALTNSSSSPSSCVSDKAISMHFVSSVLGAVTMVLFFFSSYFVDEEKRGEEEQDEDVYTKGIVALLFTVILGLSPAVVKQFTETEVFALHYFFVALILFLFLSWQQRLKSKEPLLLLAGSVATGLSLSNQHISIFLVVPVVIIVLPCTPHLLSSSSSIKLLCAVGICFVSCAFLPYLYLFVSSRFLNPGYLFSWGDCSNLFGLVHHILRRDYGTFQLHVNDKAAQFLSTLFVFFNWCWGQWEKLGYAVSINNKIIIIPSYVLPRFMLMAFIVSFGMRKMKRRTNCCLYDIDVPFGIFFFSFVIPFHCLANLDVDNNKNENDAVLHQTVMERFWVHPFIILNIWICLSVQRALLLYRQTVQGVARQVMKTIVLVVVVVAVLFAPLPETTFYSLHINSDLQLSTLLFRSVRGAVRHRLLLNPTTTQTMECVMYHFAKSTLEPLLNNNDNNNNNRIVLVTSGDIHLTSLR
eukprot:PhM_4_TR1537/c0_g1_i1/m.17